MSKLAYKVENGKLYTAEVETDIRKNGGDCFFCHTPVYVSSGQALKYVKGQPTHKKCRK